MDRLNHHDRIINYNSDSKKQSKRVRRLMLNPTGTGRRKYPQLPQEQIWPV
jgi:hypothetical protein